MKRLFLFIYLSCSFFSAFSQVQGKVMDVATGEPLSSASIILFSAGKKAGLVANKEGVFSFVSAYDSIRISMVGFRSKTFFSKEYLGKNYFEVKLESVPAELGE